MCPDFRRGHVVSRLCVCSLLSCLRNTGVARMWTHGEKPIPSRHNFGLRCVCVCVVCGGGVGSAASIGAELSARAPASVGRPSASWGAGARLASASRGGGARPRRQACHRADVLGAGRSSAMGQATLGRGAGAWGCRGVGAGALEWSCARVLLRERLLGASGALPGFRVVKGVEAGSPASGVVSDRARCT